MLQYTRKAVMQNRILSTTYRKTEQVNLDTEPMLTYCNWSYSKKYHLKQNDLINILKIFKRDKAPYYIRIFNEISIISIQSFMDNNDIYETQLKNIWTKLQSIRGVRLRDNFWKEYNNNRIANASV